MFLSSPVPRTSRRVDVPVFSSSQSLQKSRCSGLLWFSVPSRRADVPVFSGSQFPPEEQMFRSSLVLSSPRRADVPVFSGSQSLKKNRCSCLLWFSVPPEHPHSPDLLSEEQMSRSSLVLSPSRRADVPVFASQSLPKRRCSRFSLLRSSISPEEWRLLFSPVLSPSRRVGVPVFSGS